MDIGFDSVISFVMFVIDGFENVYEFLTSTIAEYYDLLFGWIPGIGSTISNALSALISNVRINGVPMDQWSILVVMFGFGLFFYAVYQFCIWLLNLIT